MTVVVWFRRDLRLDDHAALAAAIATKQPLVLLYIYVHSKLDCTIALDHIHFINESLDCLALRLQRLGLSLTYRLVKPETSIDKVASVRLSLQASTNLPVRSLKRCTKSVVRLAAPSQPSTPTNSFPTSFNGSVKPKSDAVLPHQ